MVPIMSIDNNNNTTTKEAPHTPTDDDDTLTPEEEALYQRLTGPNAKRWNPYDPREPSVDQLRVLAGKVC